MATEEEFAAARAALDQYEAMWSATIVPSVARVRQQSIAHLTGEATADEIAAGYLQALMGLFKAGPYRE